MVACKKRNEERFGVPGLAAFQGGVLKGVEAAVNADLEGKRVAVIGDGSIELQVVPVLAERAGKLKVFQRHPGWVLPELGYLWSVLPEKWLERVARTHLWRQVRDPWIRRQLTPDTPLDPHHVATSNAYYPALLKAGCELVTWPVVTCCKQGIRTAEGIEHRFDCIVLAEI